MSSQDIASTQISAVHPETGKAPSLLPAPMHPEEPARSGGHKAISGCGSCLPGWWGVRSSGCRTLLEGGKFAAPGRQGTKHSLAQLGFFFLGAQNGKY